MKQLFPGEQITVAGSGKDVVISGPVSSKYVIEKAADVAGGFVEKKENVVNLLQQQEGVASNQVMLRVRFAEVSRSALQELGATLHPRPAQERLGRAAVGDALEQFAAPIFDDSKPRPASHVQRLLERVPLQLQARRRRPSSARCRARDSSRAWPNRTWWP